MTKNLIIVIVAVYIALTSCKSTIDCPMINGKRANMISNTNSNIVFVNDAGKTISFTINTKILSDPYTAKCKRDGVGLGYNCDEVCRASGSISGTSDSNRNNKNELSIDLTNIGSYKLQLDVFDFSKDYVFNPNVPIQTPNSLITNISFGIHTYDTVYSFIIDTSAVDTQKIWRVYYNDSLGIVGFDDRTTHSTYYFQ